MKEPIRRTKTVKRYFATLGLLTAVALVAWFVVPPGPAHGQGGYELTRSSVSPGGMAASGGAYTLSATIGQSDAGEATGGDYVLGGGFWGGGVVQRITTETKVFLPLVIR
jgi:hypothetical protein